MDGVAEFDRLHTRKHELENKLEEGVRADERAKTLKAVGEWLRAHRMENARRTYIIESEAIDALLRGEMPSR